MESNDIIKDILIETLHNLSENNNWIDISFLEKELKLIPEVLREIIEELLIEDMINLNNNGQKIQLTKLGKNYFIQNPDLQLQNRYENLVFKALNAKKQVEEGFIDLAESIYEIHKEKLYKKEFPTFKDFCLEKLGFSEKTIYIYLNILELINTFPNYFPKDKAIEFGHKKMRAITEGVSKVNKAEANEQKKENTKISIFSKVNSKMSYSKIKELINTLLRKL